MRASTRRNNKYRRPLSDIHCCDGGMEMRKIAVICAAALLISVLLLSASYLPVKQLLCSLLTVILSGQIVGWMQPGKKQE